jgi:hypothetical protein
VEVNVSTTGAEAELRKVSLAGLALVVTATICLRIVVRWGSYDWLTKSLAAVFVASLIIVPLAIWRKKPLKERSILGSLR